MTIRETFDRWWTLNPSSGCHEWTRALSDGYGQLYVGGSMPMKAYRFAWERKNGAIPTGMHLLHSCDNRRCVNVAHLSLGTNLDNIRDKQLRGRAHRNSSGFVRPKRSRVTVRQSFSSQYSIDPKSGCWLWNRALVGGYGCVSVRGKKIKAHRWSYRLARGPIQRGLVVMHICDTPACVNPGHLRLGTQVENVLDTVSKRRHKGAPGESNAKAKLTTRQVSEIRRRSLSGETRVSLSRQFGVSASMVSQIARGKAWKHQEVTCGS